MTIKTTTPERNHYNEMRSRAVAGEHVDEDTLIQALADAVASEERQAILDAIDAERATHRKDEVAQIAKRRKDAEKHLTGMVSQLVEANEIRARAHTDMAAAIREYDRTVGAQNQALYALRTALTESGYPTAQPRTGAESEHVHPERHPNGGGWVVWDGQMFGTAETARNAIPRFYHHLKAD